MHPARHKDKIHQLCPLPHIHGDRGIMSHVRPDQCNVVRPGLVGPMGVGQNVPQMLQNGGANGGGRVFLAKLNLQNAYWSIISPPHSAGGSSWSKVGSGRRFRYARLPFGWSYSPAICQRLVLAVVQWVLSRRGTRGWVYQDDTLLSAKRKGRLRKAVRDCATLLCRTALIVGEKSETSPTESIGFIGKQIDTRVGSIGNATGALVGALLSSVRGVGRRRLPTCAMERLLGKLCWLGKPNAGQGAFLAGAFTALQRGQGLFGRGVAKGVATVLRFSCVPQATDPLGS